MARYTITPWRSQSDLLRVRNQLYNLSGTNQRYSQEEIDNSRRDAVNQIMSWKMRGNLPHAVESTALLTDALLHQQVPGNSSFGVRAVYSAAFTRFVTGFCDIGRNRERLLEPSSMLEIANKIGLPSHFVALRHEATHEEMPSLQRLVRVTEEALEWLWNLYWSRLGEPESEEQLTTALPELRTQAKEILKTYRSARLEALRSKKRGKQEDAAGQMAETCASFVGKSPSRLDAFVNVLVEERLLCPSKRELGSSLDGAFMLWDDLLKQISITNKRLWKALIEGMLQRTSSLLPVHDVEREAMCLWIDHILADSSSMLVRSERPILERVVMQWCCMYSSRWTNFLGTKLLRLGSTSFREEWEDLLAAARLSPEGESADSSFTMVADGLFDGSEAIDNTTDMDIVKDLGSWVRAAAPIEAPFGVVW
ncbi:Pre-rRNA-processing las1 [Lecanosticta acicola]|uniref:Pre-rRNA-processing las1 n=1 Tax=Lecanosticta acicola TaxID=111012 RepID=A0AAI8Z0J7_9PEZI|nr:Pre-rRNA-processing las1 [Lecanosticta acicola]